ncbi:MAG: adenylate/guanylate cyclase domain-containing protein [Coriobacteriales bacterium]|nr:adenylate/guanylate cyclase domain-containing protein [Coriobacteriales bacterium]
MSSKDQERIQELEREVEYLRQSLAKRKRWFRQVLRRYVTDEVMRELIESNKGLSIASERREVTVLFTDIRHSTKLSDNMDPENYISFLNHYLEEMIVVIDSWQGNILSFVGDAIVAVFGAPKPNSEAARNAVCSAVAMQRCMKRVNDWNREQEYPQIEMGVSIHTGEAIVGCIGSETRMKYDVIGRNVNLAARMVSYADGGQIYISDTTLAEAGDDVIERLEGRKVVRPKGIQEEVCIHDIVGIGALRIHTT